MKSYSFQEFSKIKQSNNVINLNQKVLNQLLMSSLCSILLLNYNPFPFSIINYDKIADITQSTILLSSLLYCSIFIARNQVSKRRDF
jgi:hypothetical protein